MASSRSLASRPEFVLREVLAYLLVDTLRVPHRTAVLLACSTLHDLGLPLLYRVVEVTSDLSVRQLAALFGPVGLLTAGGRHPELGRRVVELRVGATRHYAEGPTQDLIFGTVQLPHCTRLVLNLTHRPLPDSLKPLFHLLPNVSDLVLARTPSTPTMFPIGPARDEAEEDNPYPSGLANNVGLGCHPPEDQRWPDLKRITFSGHVWWDLVYMPTDEQARISFGDWAFKTLVVDLSDWAPPPPSSGYVRPSGRQHWTAGVATLARMFLCPLPGPERVLEEVERVELRVHEEVEVLFRKEMEREREERPVDVVRRGFYVWSCLSDQTGRRGSSSSSDE